MNLVRFEIDFPLPASETFWRWFGNVAERVNAVLDERAGGVPFQLNDERFDFEAMARQYEVNVVGHNRARPNGEFRALRIVGEAITDCAGLDVVERDRRIFQRCLRRQSKVPIVIAMGNGSRFIGFGGVAESEEFPRTDEVRPRTPRIVRQPETVRAKDHVIGNHPDFVWISFSRAA